MLVAAPSNADALLEYEIPTQSLSVCPSWCLTFLFGAILQDEGSWLQRRNKRAWRMLLNSGGELGQQFGPGEGVLRNRRITKSGQVDQLWIVHRFSGPKCVHTF